MKAIRSLEQHVDCLRSYDFSTLSVEELLERLKIVDDQRIYVIAEAIRKGKEDAMKSLISVPIDQNDSIPYDIIGKFGSAEVLLKRAPEGTGVIAGGPARSVVELAGINNIRTKSLGTNNKQNVVLATIEGLAALKTPEEVATLRGKSVEEILG